MHCLNILTSFWAFQKKIAELPLYSFPLHQRHTLVSLSSVEHFLTTLTNSIQNVSVVHLLLFQSNRTFLFQNPLQARLIENEIQKSPSALNLLRKGNISDAEVASKIACFTFTDRQLLPTEYWCQCMIECKSIHIKIHFFWTWIFTIQCRLLRPHSPWQSSQRGTEHSLAQPLIPTLYETGHLSTQLIFRSTPWRLWIIRLKISSRHPFTASCSNSMFQFIWGYFKHSQIKCVKTQILHFAHMQSWTGFWISLLLFSRHHHLLKPQQLNLRAESLLELPVISIVVTQEDVHLLLLPPPPLASGPLFMLAVSIASSLYKV